MKVSEIQAGKGVEGRFLAAQVERRTASNGRDYLRTVLRDKGGDSIVALQFDAPDSVFDAVTPGTTVEVRGEAEEYRGSTNLKIASIEPAAEQWDASELLPKSVKSEADMTATLHEYVGRIEDPAIRTVVERVLSYPDVGDRLGRWPAAMRRHHAQIGGLLEHILELLLITDAVVELYPSVSKDLVYAGCILHDIGKVAELGIEGQIDYTPVGLMVGHVVLGAEMVSRACAGNGMPGRYDAQAPQYRPVASRDARMGFSCAAEDPGSSGRAQYRHALFAVEAGRGRHGEILAARTRRSYGPMEPLLGSKLVFGFGR